MYHPKFMHTLYNTEHLDSESIECLYVENLITMLPQLLNIHTIEWDNHNQIVILFILSIYMREALLTFESL
jgi:hypothetical protein